MLAHLTTDAAILLLTLGILLIYVECNRPGRVVPGALGLLLVLLAIAGIVRAHPGPVPVLLLLSGSALLGLDLLRPTPLLITIAGTVAVVAGFFTLPGGGALHLIIALLCGMGLTTGTSFLTGIARRARASKRLD